MTTTQIQYWNMKETVRHNVAMEGENVRHNKATEALSTRDLNIKSYSAKESKRHNIATERLTAKDIDEKIRHNKTSEALTAQQIAIQAAAQQEAARHNAATESLTQYANETQRKSVENQYKLGSVSNDIKQQSVDIERMFKSAKSVTDFANMLENVDLDITAKIYAIEELLVNPNISKDSKEKLLKLARGFYDELNSKSYSGLNNKKTSKDQKKMTQGQKNVNKKFTHH